MVVEAVMIFGSGVAGMSVLTHMHTPPTAFDFTIAKGKTFTHSPIGTHDFANHSSHRLLGFWSHADIFLGSTSLLNTHALQFHVLPVVVHLHALPIV